MDEGTDVEMHSSKTKSIKQSR